MIGFNGKMSSSLGQIKLDVKIGNSTKEVVFEVINDAKKNNTWQASFINIWNENRLFK